MKFVCFLLILIYATIVDIRHKQVYTTLQVFLLLTGFIDISIFSFIGLAATFLPIFIVALISGGIGGGDVKFCAACGFVLQGISGLIGMIIGILAAVITVPIIQKISGEKKPFALVPYLSLGFIAVAVIAL